MNKKELALKIVNEFLIVFKIDVVDELQKIPHIEKSLFDDNKEKLDEIITKHTEELLKLYTVKELSYYNRNKVKNYAYPFFKRLYLSNNIKIKSKKNFKKLDNNCYTYITQLYIP